MIWHKYISHRIQTRTLLLLLLIMSSTILMLCSNLFVLQDSEFIYYHILSFHFILSQTISMISFSLLSILFAACAYRHFFPWQRQELLFGLFLQFLSKSGYCSIQATSSLCFNLDFGCSYINLIGRLLVFILAIGFCSFILEYIPCCYQATKTCWICCFLIDCKPTVLVWVVCWIIKWLLFTMPISPIPS